MVLRPYKIVCDASFLKNPTIVETNVSVDYKVENSSYLTIVNNPKMPVIKID